MNYVVRTADQTVHEVTDITDSGNYVTRCENLLVREVVEEVLLLIELPVTCQRCLAPPQPVVPQKPKRTRTAYGNPRWRMARNLRAESIQGVRFSHKAIVAALEWFERGVEEQFTEQALDQIHLSYRFLKEILINYGRIVDDTPQESDG